MIGAQRWLLIGGCIRLLLLLYGEAQDAWLSVRYTDIDYDVFTDAARYMLAGGSPYERSTYRYSPLLAAVLLPNIWIHHAWGKVLFSAADILVGWIILRHLSKQGVQGQPASTALLVWLYNPFTATISTRGSCDVLVVVLLLAVLQLVADPRRRTAAALMYGLAVHFRIYPIIFSPSIVLFIARQRMAMASASTCKETPSSTGVPPPQQQLPSPQQRQQQQRGVAQRIDAAAAARHAHPAISQPAACALPPLVALLPTLVQEAVTFGCVSGGAFVLLGFAGYALYGWPFLQEAFLHHLTRKDPRHNFSVYFYHIYLTFGDGSVNASAAAALGWWDPLAWAWAPQVVLLLAVSWRFHAHLPMCWLLLTWVFVAFNKVVTAQYFVWYLSLLPLVLPTLLEAPPSRRRQLAMSAVAWVAAQLHWLAWAYLLEFQGLPVYLGVWCASLVFLVANTAVIVALMHAFAPAASFLQHSVRAAGGGDHHKQQ